MFDKGVIVTGIDIPFWDIVKLQVKFVIASIPAGIIVFVLLVAFAQMGRAILSR